jgi:Adenylate and Guanylate cyclase catalytic domain
MLPDKASGTLTFLFTDLEGSTRLWERFPQAMRRALERHDSILLTAVTAAGGQVVKTTGDGLMAVFGSAADAVRACLAAQRGLVEEPWQETGALRVRMGLHSGEAQLRGDDYFGPAVIRSARIMAVGHGGQVLLSAPQPPCWPTSCRTAPPCSSWAPIGLRIWGGPSSSSSWSTRRSPATSRRWRRPTADPTTCPPRPPRSSDGRPSCGRSARASSASRCVCSPSRVRAAPARLDSRSGWPPTRSTGLTMVCSSSTSLPSATRRRSWPAWPGPSA